MLGAVRNQAIWAYFVATLLIAFVAASCGSEKEAVQTPKGISAQQAYSRATGIARQWNKEARLVDVASERTIEKFVENPFTPSGHWVVSEVVLEDVEQLRLSARPVDLSLGSEDQPIALQWIFTFVADRGYRVIHVTVDAIRSEGGSIFRDVGTVPIANWNIDSIGAVEAARKATAPHPALQRQGYFRLKMWKVNGSWIPLWTVPLQLQNGRFFVVTADTGKILFPPEDVEQGIWNTFEEVYGNQK